MGDYKIVKYTPDWHDALYAFMHKTFPHKPLEYIEYCIKHSEGIVPSIMVVTRDNEVVGSHLYFCTKALLNAEIIETQWGHDTYLNQDYRKKAGVDFLLVRKKIPAFGVGLTESNAKMRKLMKSVFLEGVYNYYSITPAVLLSPFQRLFNTKTVMREIDYLIVKDKVFRRVNSSCEINIPNGGFWYKGYNELDFIRDADFLDYRFFNCKVHDYKVYASDDSYFVVRDSTYRGFPALLLSDFRYNPIDKDSANKLLKAVMKIARKSKIGIVYFVCGDKNVDVFFKNRIHHKTHLDFITSYNISPDTTFSLCGGDSDAEFLKA